MTERNGAPVFDESDVPEDATEWLEPRGDGDQASHRGAFGDFGGESDGLIERTFRERIVLVGVTTAGHDPEETDASLDELALLVDTAGADAVVRLHQRRSAPDAATYVGKGKAQEIKQAAVAVDCDTVVFDDELTPAQQYNLEKILGRSALDRTAVILDIFAQNASSQEGKAQVELAQLRYRLPRLRASGRTFSQQGGGIGTRGPGETQLAYHPRGSSRRNTPVARRSDPVAAAAAPRHRSSLSLSLSLSQRARKASVRVLAWWPTSRLRGIYASPTWSECTKKSLLMYTILRLPWEKQ